MKKIYFCFIIAAALAAAAGCGPSLVTEMKRAGSTTNNDYYAVMAVVKNEHGPAATAVTIVAEPKGPSYRRTTITNTGGQSSGTTEAAANKAWEPPKASPRGKKALICPPTPPTPKPAPAKPSQIYIETVKSPETMVIGGAGGTGTSTLQSWGNALLSGAGVAAGMIGSAPLLRPARTTVTQTGGGAKANAVGGTGVGYGGAGGSAYSNSISNSGAEAAAAAATGN